MMTPRWEPGQSPKGAEEQKKTAMKKDEKCYPQEDSLQNEAMFMLPCYVSKGPLQTHQALPIRRSPMLI